MTRNLKFWKYIGFYLKCVCGASPEGSVDFGHTVTFLPLCPPYVFLGAASWSCSHNSK